MADVGASRIRPSALGWRVRVAFLKVIKGSVPGQILELRGERAVIGRHPSCEIVLDNAAVSRHHAQILESHGSFFVEDLRSRNRTYVNKVPIDGRTELHEGDLIRICDLAFTFHLQLPAAEESDSRVENSDSGAHRADRRGRYDE